MSKVKSPLSVGNDVIIRTVTYHYIGHIEEINDKEIILSRASWLAESDRWSVTLQTGSVKELEPYVGNVSINLASYVDATEWKFKLPEKAIP